MEKTYEEYEALMDRDLQNPPIKVTLRVNVDEVKYCELNVASWVTLCAIEDLCFVSIRFKIYYYILYS